MAQTLYARALPDQLAAPVDRFINAVLSEGVWDLAGDHFEVVEQSTPGMSVRCGSGTAGDMAVVAGDASLQGRYIVQNQDSYVGDGDAELSIGNGDPSDPRIDLIVLRVYDDEMDSSGSTKAEVEVVEGTPASSPSTPSTPDGAIALAEVLVGAGESTSIGDGDITDLREQSSPAGPLAFATAEVTGQFSATATTTSLETNEKIVATISLDIPSGWNSYDVHFGFVIGVDGRSASAKRDIIYRVREDGLAGTKRTRDQRAVITNGDGDSAGRLLHSIAGGAEGLTDVGAAKPIVFTTQLGGADTITAEGVDGWARAVRVS